LLLGTRMESMPPFDLDILPSRDTCSAVQYFWNWPSAAFLEAITVWGEPFFAVSGALKKQFSNRCCMIFP
jgi:hypothetical protein